MEAAMIGPTYSLRENRAAIGFICVSLLFRALVTIRDRRVVKRIMINDIILTKLVQLQVDTVLSATNRV